MICITPTCVIQPKTKSPEKPLNKMVDNFVPCGAHIWRIVIPYPMGREPFPPAF